MSDDITDFIRRAAARRQQQAQGRRPQQAPLRPQRPPDLVIRDAEVVDATILEAETVEGHVTRHLNTSAYTERAGHLGEEVGLADDLMEAHLHEAFDHDVGTLARGAEQAKTPSAGELADLLKDPQSMRRAIILREIIDRPEHRW